MTTYQERLINILDRKYRLLVKTPAQDFSFEFVQFMDFIQTNEHIRPHVSRMLRDFNDWVNSYKPAILEEVEEAKRIRSELAQEFREIDDSDMEQPPLDDGDPVAIYFEHPYFRSFAAFDAVTEQVEQDGPEIWPAARGNHQNDRSEVAIIRRILSNKIDQIPDPDVKVQYINRLQNLNERHRHLHQDFIIQSHGRATAALYRLTELREAVNPPPAVFATMDERMDALAAALPQALAQHNVVKEQCLPDLERVYEALRANIGSQLAHYELVYRYKARCMFYDRERLIQLANDAGRKKEETLTRDLAKYLFDNGVSTLYRAIRGTHEYDLLAPTIAVEAKQYNRSRRKYLIDGVSQFHSYINGLEADTTRDIRELYYVIFRLGGPLYDWPLRIEMNRWTIYPVIIDLAPSRESGSRQSRVQPITLPEILASFPDEEE